MSEKSWNRLLAIGLGLVLIVWLVVPFAMAVLWSLVDPDKAWSYPDLLPQKLSFRRWTEMWETTNLAVAIANSYTLAPIVACATLMLAAPTAYAFGRLEFAGKSVAQFTALLPLVLPGFVIALFFTALLNRIGIYNKFLGIVIGHTVLFLPYAIRILSVSYSLVRQDLIDAARDLGASRWARFSAAYLPVLKPGILAALVIVFIQSIEEFALSFVLGSPDFTTVPTILYSYLGYNFIRPNAAVVSLILVVPNIILMLLFERLLKSNGAVALGGKG
ncbi:ABC transporter permease [Rhizobium sp. L43]|uniref:ABC transporter permease n=1 Tax=Rhizobium sp. L43 TaxID=2035452 RepID=UPI000BEA4D1E|nr:ABC transporter permease [Rhizobium sp. L43]PDS76135.1 spermidine/putrescine ABC transporter permease [Rhizobium sp. L43]